MEYIREEMEARANKLIEEIDMVNHPSHYTKGGIECIDIIKVITKNYSKPFCGLLVGNVVKYIYRAPNKNGLEDLKKAQWYLNKLIEEWTNNERI